MPPRANKSVNSAEGGKRYPLNIRTTFEVRRDLEAAASASGRSLTQEAETRIISSFNEEHASKVMEGQLKKWFEMADQLKAQIKDLLVAKEVADETIRSQHSRLYETNEALNQAKLALITTQSLLSEADNHKELYSELAAALTKEKDAALARAELLEKSRDRLVHRTDELVELLAQARGVRSKGAS